MTDVRVRGLRYRDLRAVAQIERTAFGTPWPRREFAFELAKPGSVCFAALAENDVLAGYLISCQQGPMWNLRNIAVAASHRGRGVASALLRALLATSSIAGSPVVLEVRASHARTITLYERFGFRAAGRRPQFYGDDGEDALLMWRDPRR